MTITKMREELVTYFEAMGQSNMIEEIQKLTEEEVQKNYERFLVEETYEKARTKLDEVTTQKSFDLWKGRAKLD